MELWIRSQDKTYLTKVNNLYIPMSRTGETWCIKQNELYLAFYKSKERALEVLDEIQSKLKIICTDSIGGEYILAKNLIPIIYEMPEE